jgi:hypothetical protein
MSRKSQGQVRRSQVITTYGPGALIDLPKHSAIVGGLETWPKTSDLEEIPELRLTRKLQIMTGVPAPRLFTPPPDENDPRESAKRIGVWRFPEWFIVQESSRSAERERSRRLVHRKELDDKGRFDGRPVVALASCAPARRDKWMISTGGASCTALKIPAANGCGSTSVAPVVIWRILS